MALSGRTRTAHLKQQERPKPLMLTDGTPVLKRRRSTSAKVKDRNAPKKPLTGYLIFCQGLHVEVRRPSRPRAADAHTCPSFPTLPCPALPCPALPAQPYPSSPAPLALPCPSWPCPAHIRSSPQLPCLRLRSSARNGRTSRRPSSAAPPASAGPALIPVIRAAHSEYSYPLLRGCVAPYRSTRTPPSDHPCRVFRYRPGLVYRIPTANSSAKARTSPSLVS